MFLKVVGELDAGIPVNVFPNGISKQMCLAWSTANDAFPRIGPSLISCGETPVSANFGRGLTKLKNEKTRCLLLVPAWDT